MSELEIIETILYQGPEGAVFAEVYVGEDTIWTTQKGLGKLFEVDRTVITKHLKNIFESEELNKNSVCAKIAHTASDGKNYKVNLYNLDAIIAVGYRVNTKKATYFRQWATKILKEYMIKGFVLNDEALKNGGVLGKDYFDELLERIREIMLPGYEEDMEENLPTYTPTGEWVTDSLSHYKVAKEDSNVKCSWGRHQGTTCSVCNYGSSQGGQGGQGGESEEVDYKEVQSHVWKVTATETNSDGKPYEQLKDEAKNINIKLIILKY